MKSNFSRTIMAISILTIIVLFQNCSRESFQVRTPSTAELISQETVHLPSENFGDISLPGESDVNNSSNNQTELPVPKNEEPVFLSNSTTSTGKIYYVAKTGSNSNPGTSTKPFKTIPYGYSKLNPGDTLIVKAGIYSEYKPQYGIHLNRSGKSGAPITIKSEVKGAAIIDMLNRSDAQHVLYLSASYNTIEGFRLRNGYKGGMTIYGSYNKIIRNEIHNNGNKGDPKSSYGHDGIFSGKYTKGNFYNANNIHHNGRKQCGTSTTCNLDHGLYLCGDNEVIINNIITHNSSYGITIAGYDTVSNMQIYNNVFAFNGRSAGVIWKAMSGVYIKNNIFYKNVEYGFTASNASGPNIVFANNVYYGNGVKTSRLRIEPPNSKLITESNVFTFNPLFVSELNRDYRLQKTSPAINKGANLSTVVKTDYLGILRPRGGIFDIGAFEY